MSVLDARYERQMRLREVGEAGQRKIATSVLGVGHSTSAEVEAMYLERAGVLHLHRGDETESSFAHGHVFQYSAPRAFGGGAWRALRQLGRVLELGEVETERR